ncbi:hypothetical protein DL98DRAFT_605117 [Cadophora sp. DSE1049]|nr:hypothetical protein DL98DRAFT_605117 [Cadophora sp. DSE1049]
MSVWLGPADDTSDMVMDYLNHLGEEAQACGMERLEDPVHIKWCELATKPVEYRDKGKIADGGNIMYHLKEEDDSGKEIKVAQLWTNNLYYSISDRHDADMLFPVEAMATFFKRKWWSRIWVLQEFALAKAVGFVCGKKTLTRRKCTAALGTFTTYREVILTSIRANDRKLTEYESAVAEADFDPRPKMILGIRKNIHKAQFTLMSLLKMTCIEYNQSMKQREHSLQATDPKDKIYGLLGIASDYDVLKLIAERDALRVIPNYVLSCAEIFTEFAMAMMMQGYPSILSLCQSPKSISGLPSWVPDWSTPLKLQLQATMSINEPVLSPQYLACGSSSAAKIQFFWTDKHETVCSIDGLILDKIAATGTTYSDITEKSKDAVAWVREWIRVLNNLSKQRTGAYESDDERILAVFRVTTADFCVDEAGKWARATEKGLAAASMVHG